MTSSERLFSLFFVSILLIVVGLILLVYGANWFVKGASSLAKSFKIPSIVIGLTIVAMGTSAPELSVNLSSAFAGNSDIALGNVIGSNIVNILLILGIAAMITNLSVQKNTTRKEIPYSLFAAVALLVMSADVFFDGAVNNVISRSEGLILLAFFGIFLYYVYRLTRQGQIQEEEVQVYPLWQTTGMIVAGLAMLVLGGRWIVEGAVDIASMLGVSEKLIGLTIVAIGTSLPELATSVVAALQKKADIAVGNIVGSNIFNVFFILGTTAIVKPLPLDSALFVDIGVLMATTIFLFLAMYVGKRHTLERWQGGMMILAYIAYTAFLVIRG